MAEAARRDVVRQLQERGPSERQALRLVGMSASTLRLELRDDGTDPLRECLMELAGQHHRHKMLLVPERQRLVRPMQPDEVWSMDFVFDELANGRSGAASSCGSSSPAIRY